MKSTSAKEHINTLGPEGDTLLHLACLYAHEECAQVLLEHGADVTVVDEDCSTVLHDAAAGGCVPTQNNAVSVLRVIMMSCVVMLSCNVFLLPGIRKDICI